jgi:protein phosphatase PTC7
MDMLTIKMSRMKLEALEPIQQTLSEIDDRTPDALRVAFSLGRRVSPAPAPGEEDRVASFAASVLPPPPLVVYEDADANDPGQLHEEVPLASTSEDDATKLLRMEWASCYLPDHDEDAHFGHDEAGVLGVAHGVGSYRNRGVDAAAFSRGLMTSAFMHVLAIEPGTPVCPYTLLERAYDETVASAASGASTAVILSLAGATLKWAYIGDSAFAVLRAARSCTVRGRSKATSTARSRSVPAGRGTASRKRTSARCLNDLHQ